MYTYAYVYIHTNMYYLKAQDLFGFYAHSLRLQVWETSSAEHRKKSADECRLHRLQKAWPPQTEFSIPPWLRPSARPWQRRDLQTWCGWTWRFPSFDVSSRQFSDCCIYYAFIDASDVSTSRSCVLNTLWWMMDSWGVDSSHDRPRSDIVFQVLQDAKLIIVLRCVDDCDRRWIAKDNY